MCRSSGPSPDAAGAQADVLSGTLDIAATILDRARVQPYNGIQGVSLLPAINGDGAAMARDSMVIEDDQQRAVLGYPPGARLRTIVTRRWRMTIAHGDPGGALRSCRATRTRWTICSTIPAIGGARRVDGKARLSPDGVHRSQPATDGPRLRRPSMGTASRALRFPRSAAWAMCSARPLPLRDSAMFPKPKSALTPNTYAYESEPLVKPTGFREYDARWLLEQEINLMGVQALGMGLGTLFHELGVKPEIVTATTSAAIRPR